MKAQDPQTLKRVHLADFHIAGFNFWDGCEAFKYLDMGLEDIYEVRITRVTPDVHPEQQVEVVVYVKNQRG